MITFDFGYIDGTKAGQDIIANDLALNKEHSYQTNVLPFKNAYEAQRFQLETSLDPNRFRNERQTLDQAFELNPLVHRNNMQQANLEYSINPTRYSAESAGLNKNIAYDKADTGMVNAYTVAKTSEYGANTAKNQEAAMTSTANMKYIPQERDMVAIQRVLAHEGEVPRLQELAATNREAFELFNSYKDLRATMHDINRQYIALEQKAQQNTLTSGEAEQMIKLAEQLRVGDMQLQQYSHQIQQNALMGARNSGLLGSIVTNATNLAVQQAAANNAATANTIGAQNITNTIDATNLANGTAERVATAQNGANMATALAAAEQTKVAAATTATNTEAANKKLLIEKKAKVLGDIDNGLFTGRLAQDQASAMFASEFPKLSLDTSTGSPIVFDKKGNGYSFSTFYNYAKQNAAHDLNSLAPKLQSAEQQAQMAKDHAALVSKAVDLVTKTVSGKQEVTSEEVVASLVGAIGQESLQAAGASTNVDMESMLSAIGGAGKRMTPEQAMQLANQLIQQFSPYNLANTQAAAMPKPEYERRADGSIVRIQELVVNPQPPADTALPIAPAPQAAPVTTPAPQAARPATQTTIANAFNQQQRW